MLDTPRNRILVEPDMHGKRFAAFEIIYDNVIDEMREYEEDCREYLKAFGKLARIKTEEALLEYLSCFVADLDEPEDTVIQQGICRVCKKKSHMNFKLSTMIQQIIVVSNASIKTVPQVGAIKTLERDNPKVQISLGRCRHLVPKVS